MSLIVCWLLFPIVVGVLSLGCGLLVGRIAGVRLSGALKMPVGLAMIVVASEVVTYRGATARLATPLVVVLALAGYATALQRRRPHSLRAWVAGVVARLDRFAGATALGVFAVFAAPVVLSGSATFLGYTLLGDDSVHFALIDWVMHHGQQVSNLAPSSYHSVLAGYLGTSYPLGAHTGIGSVRPLVGQDVAWIYQPFLAFVGAMSALSFYAALSRAIGPRWLRALAAFLAAQPGLVYAYSLEGSVKELATVWLLALTVALAAEWVDSRGGPRAVIPLAVTVAAGMGILNVSVLPWLAPALALALLARLLLKARPNWRPLARDAGVFLALAAALSFPALAVLNSFVQTANTALTGSTETGNLLGPLSNWQVFGIWPSGDFRIAPTGHIPLTYALIGIEIAAVALGALAAVRYSRGWPLVLAVSSLIGWAYVTARGSPWSDAKALMLASPAVVVVAMLGVAALWEIGRRTEGLVLAAVVAFGILWTNALAYHDADLAPRGRLSELASIGSRFGGEGPTLYPEAEEFAKHFLRTTDPSGSSEAWQDNPRAVFANGGGPAFGFSSDIDQLALPYVEHYRSLVLRNSGSASRPPSNYELKYDGRYYAVWQRMAGTVRSHLALGDPVQPAAPAPCPALKSLSAAGNRLAFVTRPKLPVLFPTQANHPRGWANAGPDALSLRPLSPGTVSGQIEATAPGRYTVWLQGSFSRGFTVSIDGRRVGSVHNALNPGGDYESAGSVQLAAGSHQLTLARPKGNLSPGSGAAELLGPVVLAPANGSPAVETLPAARWHDLCGRRLDWVEALP